MSTIEQRMAALEKEFQLRDWSRVAEKTKWFVRSKLNDAERYDYTLAVYEAEQRMRKQNESGLRNRSTAEIVEYAMAAGDPVLARAHARLRAEEVYRVQVVDGRRDARVGLYAIAGLFALLVIFSAGS